MTDEPNNAAATLGVVEPLAPAVGISPLTEPLTFETAGTRKAELLRNTDFVTRYLNGEVAARREIDAVNLALSQPPGDAARTTREIEIGSLRAWGDISEAHIEEYASGKGVTQAEKDFAADKYQQCMRDLGWRQRYLEGDRVARREAILMGLIKSAPLKVQ
jgi:hypothetical protein